MPIDINNHQEEVDSILNEINDIKITRKRDRRMRIDVKADAVPALLGLIKGRGSYVHLSAISCVDWIEDEQFELVYHCWSYEHNNLISIHTRISRKESKFVSVYDLYKPAGFFERDIYEMYGVYFTGSPYMEKFILTEWNGVPPMLKDFDAEAYVEETFNWTEYNPEWLQELTAQGGGVVITPEQMRKSV